jgi:hypothetical protein
MLIINCLFSIGKKGSSGVCGVEMWKKSTVGIPQFPSLPLKSCSSEVCSIAAIKSGAVAVVAFSFQGGSVFDLYLGRITRTKELSACGL